MENKKYGRDAIHWYMSELSARVVAESGRASDRYHLGKLILQGLKDAPDFILQIDGSTGQTETFQSVLQRSVRCANAFKTFGLQTGDVIILMAPNYLDLIIPYYASYYLGVIIAPIDRLLQAKELEHMFSIDQPKLVFCKSEKAEEARRVLDNLKLNTKIITFDELCENVDNSMFFDEFVKKYGNDADVEKFRPSDFDPAESPAMLISTSGTTGLPKQAVVTHKNFVIANPLLWSRELKFPTPTKMYLVLSPLQWLSAILNFNLAPLLKFTLLISPQPMTQDHVYYLINTYKPTYLLSSPTFLTTIIKSGEREKCDFSSVEFIFAGGSAVSAELIDELKALAPNAEVYNMYGLSEICAQAFLWNFSVPRGSCGKPAPHLQHRLINIETQEDIKGPNESGELWLKGPSVFKGYYKNEAATNESFSEDGWFKTGDMFYRDEHWNFFFTERIKLMLKYKNHQISPVEIQILIRQHPAVLDVVVTGIPDDECGDLAVACVVRRPGHHVDAQEIKDLVKESLTDSKQLRGGVVFLEEIPMTSSTKVDCRTLKQIISSMKIE